VGIKERRKIKMEGKGRGNENCSTVAITDLNKRAGGEKEKNKYSPFNQNIFLINSSLLSHNTHTSTKERKKK
jgi:hypothetical protein